MQNYSQPEYTWNVEVSTDLAESWVKLEEYKTLIEANDTMLRASRNFPKNRYRVVEIKHNYKVVS